MAFGKMGARGGFGSAGALGGAPTFIQAGGGRAGVPNVGSSTNAGGLGGGTATQFQEQFPTQIGDIANALEIQVEYGNLISDSAAFRTVLDGPSNLTLSVGINFTGATTFQQLIWQTTGTKDVTLAPGERVKSNWMPIPAGAKTNTGRSDHCVFGRYASIPAYWPASTDALGSNGVQFGTALVDRTLNPVFFGGGTTFALLPPLNIFVRRRTKAASVILLGDSITSAGSADTGGGTDVGYLRKALFNLGIPYANIGATGLALRHLFSSGTAAERARHLGPYVVANGYTHLIVPLWVNDERTGGNVATYQSDINAINAYFAPFLKVILVTPQPLTNATNTAEDPLYPGSWARRQQIITWIKTNPLGNGYLDIASVTQDPVLIDQWRSDLPIPADGTHPGTATHNAATTYVQSALPALVTV